MKKYIIIPVVAIVVILTSILLLLSYQNKEKVDLDNQKKANLTEYAKTWSQLSLEGYYDFWLSSWLNLDEGKCKIATSEFEKLLESWKYEPNMISSKTMNSIFNCYILLWNYDVALGMIYDMVQSVWPQEWLVWSYIKEDDLSDSIIQLASTLKTEGGLNANDSLEYAKLLYKAWDYYYEKDKEKFRFAIIYHYLAAYSALEDALESNPNNSELYFYQWRLIMDIGNSFHKAEEKLLKAVELNQGDYRYYYRLWNAYMHQDKYELAKDAFIKSIELDKDFEKSHLNLWNMYFKLWEDDKWYESYRNWMKICKNHCDSYNYNMWLHLYNDWEYLEARSYIEISLSINPNREDSKRKLKQIDNIINKDN